MSNHYAYCSQFIVHGGKILDVGSGRGAFLREMAKRGYDVRGIEPSPDYIRESCAQAFKENLNIFIERGSAEHLPFYDGEFDFINCAEVSEHVENPKQMCEEIFRVLKPGGRCYISFHNRFGIYDYHYHALFINWMPRSWAEFLLKIFSKGKQDSIIGRQKLSTMHYYTYGEAVCLLNKAGFSVADIRTSKIKRRFKHFALFFLFLYYILRPFYFNSFHLLVEKEPDPASDVSNKKIRFLKTDFLKSIIAGEAIALLSLPILKNLNFFEIFTDESSSVAYILLGCWLLFVPLGLGFILYITYKLAVLFRPVIFELGKYGIIGWLNVFLHAGALNILILITGSTQGLLVDGFYVIAFVITLTHSFVWNKYWTFNANNTSKGNEEYIKFFAVSSITAFINLSLFHLIINVIGAQQGIDDKTWANIALAVLIPVSVLGNFIGYKIFVFKRSISLK